MNVICSTIYACLVFAKTYLGHSGVNAMKDTNWIIQEVKINIF